MNKKNVIYVLLICAILIVVIYFVMPDNNSSNTKINSVNQNDQQVSLLSYEHQNPDFSFFYNSDFSYFEDSTLGDAIKSYTFKKLNSNTSEDDNRDTPNGFNTSADDVMGLNIYKNKNQLDTNNIEEFISWYEQDNISPSSGISGTPSAKKIGDNMVIEAIIADGIDSFSRALYFSNDYYIVEISSADVSKDDLYDMADSFKFNDK